MQKIIDDQTMSKELQGPYLDVLCKEKIPVAIYLINGIKLQGQIESFDQFVLVLGMLLPGSSVKQTVYKHAIATIVPTREVDIKMTKERAPI